jgi:hypothetical protein
MSDRNISADRNSLEFELLLPEEESPEEEVYLSLDEMGPKVESHKSENMGVVIDEDTYVILDREEGRLGCSEEQWREFIREQQELAKAVGVQGKEHRTSLTYCQRNSLLQLEATDFQKRKELFEIANYTSEIEAEFAAQYEEDQQQNKQYFLNLLSSELTEEELTSFKKNMLKLHKVVRKMGESETPDGVRLREKEKEIMQWIYDALISYALIDPQLRYTKGL